MYYSTIGLLALLVLLLENQGVLFRRGEGFDGPTWATYRGFLFVIIIYYLTDIVWGFLEEEKLSALLFLDTTLYFIAMATGVLFWTKFAVSYLDEETGFGRFLQYAGRVYCGAMVVLVAVNAYFPVLFSVDEQGVYEAGLIRYAALVVQIGLLFLTAIYALSAMQRADDAKRRRYRTIAWFGLITGVFLAIQLWFPFLPLYTVAFMLGTCLLHTFVISDERDEYRAGLAAAEAEQAQARQDALTGVKNRRAYLSAEDQLDRQIEEGGDLEFAVVIFDVNDLKVINDTEGHQAGDQYLRDACKIVCHIFAHSPVFRVGGDEFAVIVQGGDYEILDELLAQVAEHNAEASRTGGIVIACGMARYAGDACVADLFERADLMMYANKSDLKAGK